MPRGALVRAGGPQRPRGPQTRGRRATNPDAGASRESESPESEARRDTWRLLRRPPSPSPRPARAGTLPTFPRAPAPGLARPRPTRAASRCPRLGRASPPVPLLTARGPGSAPRRPKGARRALRPDGGRVQGRGRRWAAACAPRSASAPTPAPCARRARGALCRRLRRREAALRPGRDRPHPRIHAGPAPDSRNLGKGAPPLKIPLKTDHAEKLLLLELHSLRRCIFLSAHYFPRAGGGSGRARGMPYAQRPRELALAGGPCVPGARLISFTP